MFLQSAAMTALYEKLSYDTIILPGTCCQNLSNYITLNSTKFTDQTINICDIISTMIPWPCKLMKHWQSVIAVILKGHRCSHSSRDVDSKSVFLHLVLVRQNILQDVNAVHS